MMMVELFFGYPLRLVASALAAGLLSATGLPVTRTGAMLAWRGATVWVDAPCSGVRMLWSGVWLGMTVCGVVGMGWGGTVAAGLLTVAIVILANALRVVGLTLVEGGLLPSGPGFHLALGGMLFAGGAVAVVAGIRWLARLPGLAPAAAPDAGGKASDGAGPRDRRRTRHAFAAYLLASLCAAAMGVERQPPSVPEAEPFPGWPTRFEGLPLQETPLTEQEAAFNTAFPGRIARFANGERVVILRWVCHPTHRVHSAADCLQSSGHRITYGALAAAPDGDWSAFTATHDGTTLWIRERCHDETGKTWPDVSSWFWAALAGQTRGPWWVVTVVSPAAP
jgi:exosortase/archaeosortase family protein